MSDLIKVADHVVCPECSGNDDDCGKCHGSGYIVVFRDQ